MPPTCEVWRFRCRSRTSKSLCFRLLEGLNITSAVARTRGISPLTILSLGRMEAPQIPQDELMGRCSGAIIRYEDAKVRRGSTRAR